MPGLGLGLGLGLDSAVGGGIASPLQVSGCVLWLRANRGIGVADNNPVSAWTDQSTGGNSAAQVTGAKQPTYHASSGPNGLPCVTFSGSNTMQIGSGVIPARNWTVFYVFKSTTNAVDQMTNLGSMIARNASGTRELFLTGVANEDADAMTNGWEAWTLADDGTHQSMRVNGVAKTLSSNSSVPNSGATQSFLGSWDGTNSMWVGPFFEVLAYTPALGASDVAKVEAYIRAATAIW